MKTGKRLWNCHFRTAAAIGPNPAVFRSAQPGRVGVCPQKVMLGKCTKKRAPVRREGRPNVSSMLVWVCRADPPYNDQGRALFPIACGLTPGVRRLKSATLRLAEA